jgi:hypothetical protein
MSMFPKSYVMRARRNGSAAGLILALAVAPSMAPLTAAAQDGELSDLTPRLLFAISGGAWSTIPAAEPDASSGEQNDADGSGDAEDEAADAATGDERGYYRALAYRSEDNTSRLYLQRIALGENGPETVESTEITDITTLGAYITDLRPENSTGASSTAGFTAFVYLKRDPADSAAETFELFVDEFGDVTIDGATN